MQERFSWWFSVLNVEACDPVSSDRSNSVLPGWGWRAGYRCPSVTTGSMPVWSETAVKSKYFLISSPHSHNPRVPRVHHSLITWELHKVFTISVLALAPSPRPLSHVRLVLTSLSPSASEGSHCCSVSKCSSDTSFIQGGFSQHGIIRA